MRRQDHIRLLVVSDFKKREVTRKLDSKGGEIVSSKPWIKTKEQKTSQLKLDADLAIRFTDGETIYHLTMGPMRSALLTLYSIEKSGLLRKEAVR